MKKHVVIVGAGPSGLTAAYSLLKRSQDYDVTIIEKESYVGGISRTFNYKGNRMDIGGHRFFSKNERVNELWDLLMPIQGKPAFDDKILDNKKDYSPNGPDPETEDRVMLLRHRVSRIYFLKKFFDYPISLKLKTFTNMGFRRTVQCGIGYLSSCLHKRKENSLADFYINRFGKPLYRLFFEDYTTKLWGVSPEQLAPDWGAQRVKSLSLGKTLINAITKPFKKKNGKVETSLIEQFKYPKKGPGQLYEIMADEILSQGGKIIFLEDVNKINIEDNRIVSIETNQNHVYKVDEFISSMPIKDLLMAIGEDKVEAEAYKVGTTLPYRDFLTVGLLIDKLKIQNKTKIKTLNNIVPDNWIYVQERTVKMGRIQIFNNWSPYMVKDPINTVFMGLEYFCNEGDSMWNMKDDEFISFAIDELVSMGIIESKDNVLDSCLLHVKKAYPAYFGSYNEFSKVRKYLDTIDNLWCVGRNGQHRYNNMDHSMLSSMVCIDNILDAKRSKDDVFNVNTEQDYHEANESK